MMSAVEAAKYVRSQVGEQVVRKIISSVCGHRHGRDQADSDKELQVHDSKG